MATELFSLGKLYPSDFLKPDEQPRCEPVELKLVMEDNGLVHLEKTAPKDVMWGERYWYSSSVSDTMKSQLRNVVDSVLDVYKVGAGDMWVDIAGNSGYMLSQVPKEVLTVSIDPVGGEIREECLNNCDVVISNYFSEELFKQYWGNNTKADVVSIISMFYDISEPDKFLKDVAAVMHNDSLLVIQLSYSPLMLSQLEFGNLCHEHYYYYSFFNLKELLERNGFKVMDATLNNTNAGSLRLFIMKETADISKFGSPTHRGVCKFRMDSLIHYERLLDLDYPDGWLDFFDRINDLKAKTVHFIETEKDKGKVIYGYGASTKFNTVLQYFGLTNETITAIADRSEAKHGLRTVGSDIPIISEEQARKDKPDYMIVGPAHFLQEFMERERELLEGGMKFIVIMPEFKVVGL